MAAAPRATRIAGIILVVYIVWYVTDLVVLDLWPGVFMDLHRWYGSLGARLVFVAVGLALVHHSLDGLRITFRDIVPAVADHDVASRAVVRFLTMAIWIPVALAIVWPALRRWGAG